MKIALNIVFLVISNLISAQKPGTELIFDCIKSLGLESTVQNEIAVSDGDETIAYFWFDNYNEEFKSETEPKLVIRLLSAEELFYKPVACYMKIISVKQRGKKLFFEFRIEGEGNKRCKAKNGMAKFRIADQKLIQVKWL